MAAREVLGMRADELPTPALTIDIAAVQRNSDLMARRLDGLPAALRPHVKVHKCAELARRQVQAGAIGVCTATAWEAVAMAHAGIEDILVANQVVGRDALEALVAASGAARITVAVDSAENVEEVAAVARRAGSELGVLVEVDVGMGRCGTRSVEESLALARLASVLKGIRFAGVMGYEGHCTDELDAERRARMQGEALACLREHVEHLRAAGHECGIVSAGGTCTVELTAADPLVTEVQAGTYLVGDLFHAELGTDYEVALTVTASVLSVHGADIVVDAGRKAVATELVAPKLAGAIEPSFTHEEHSGFTVEPGPVPAVGDRVVVQPGYAPLTVNLYDAMYVVDDDIVVDRWEVLARHGCPPWTI